MADTTHDIAVRLHGEKDGNVDGLLNPLLRDLEGLGVDTANARQQAQDLSAELQKLGEDQSLLDSFAKLQQSLQESEQSLAAAQQGYEELAKRQAEAREAAELLAVQTGLGKRELEALGQTVSKQSPEYLGLKEEIKRLETEQRQAASAANQLEGRLAKSSQEIEKGTLAAQKQAAELAALETKLSGAGIAAGNLAEQQARLSGAKAGAEAKAKALTESLQQEAAQTRAAAAAWDKLESGLRKGAEEEAKAAAAARETAQIRAANFHHLANEAQAARAAAAEADKLGKAGHAAAQGFDLANTSIARAVKTALGIAAATAGAYGLKEAISSIAETGGQFEQLQASLTTLEGSLKGGETAAAWIQQFAQDTPLELDQVTQAFLKLKAFGLEPADGTLRALAATNAKMGGSAEDLLGIVQSLGQAWSLQKLQAENVNELMSRGIPVWDILAKALGKTSAEVIALSQAGKIGRAEIKLLIDELGRTSGGALEAQMATLNGQISNLKDNWSKFLNLIADAGALDFFKEEIAAINEQFKEMAADGSLKARAEQISNAIISIAKGLEATVKGVWDNREAIGTLIELLAGLKLAGLAADTLSWAGGMKEAALSGKGLNAVLALTLATAGSLAFAIEKNGDALKDYAQREEAAREAARAAAAARQELYDRVAKALQDTQRYSETAIASTDELKAKSLDQARAYEEALTQAQRYWNATEASMRMAGDSRAAEIAQQRADAYGQALEVAAARAKELADGTAKIAAPNFDNTKIEAFSAKLKEAAQGGKDAEKAYQDFAASLSQGDLVAVIEQARAKITSIKTAFGENQAAAAEMAKEWQAVIDGALRESLTRLGVDAEKALSGLTGEVKKGIGEISALQTSLSAAGVEGQRAGEILVQAFAGLAGKAQTVDDLNAIRAGANQLWESGKVGRETMQAAFAAISAGAKNVKVSQLELANASREAAASADALAQKLKAGTATAADFQAANAAAARVLALQSAAAKDAAGATDGLQAKQKQAAQQAAEFSAIAAAATQREKAAHYAAVDAANAAAAANANNAAAARQAAQESDGLAQSVQQMIAQTYSAAKELSQVMADDYLKTLKEVALTIEDVIHYSSVFWQGIEAGRRALQNIEDAQNRFSSAMQNGTNLAATYREAVGLLGGSFEDVSGRLFALDSQHLTGIQSAVDSLRQRLDGLKQSAEQTLQSLQSELLQLEGNTKAIEELSYQQKLKDLQSKLDEAQNAGAQDAAGQYAQAIQLENEIHQKKLDNIKAEQTAKAAPADRPGTAQDHSRNSVYPVPQTQPAPGFSPAQTVEVRHVIEGNPPISVQVAAGQKPDYLALLARLSKSSMAA